MFVRNFAQQTMLTAYVNANSIPADDIHTIWERSQDSGWTMFFCWTAASHPPLAGSPTQQSDGEVAITGISGVTGALNIVITLGGNVGVAKFKWQLDGGALSAELATGPGVALGTTGLTAAFTDGAGPGDSFVLDDAFPFAAIIGNDPPGGKGV